MWTSKQPQADLPGTSSVQVPGAPIRPGNATPATRSSTPNSRDVACLGANLEVKGDISGSEDLQIGGTVEGSISIQGQKLTIGPTPKLNSEVPARAMVGYGS